MGVAVRARLGIPRLIHVDNDGGLLKVQPDAARFRAKENTALPISFEVVDCFLSGHSIERAMIECTGPVLCLKTPNQEFMSPHPLTEVDNLVFWFSQNFVKQYAALYETDGLEGSDTKANVPQHRRRC